MSISRQFPFNLRLHLALASMTLALSCVLGAQSLRRHPRKSDSPKKSISKTVKKPGVAGGATARPKSTVKSEKSPASAAAEADAPASSKKFAPKIPPILLEGDEPSAPPVSGPGERYALSPVPADSPESPPELTDLPEAYGTQRLLLTARDPHWLYAHWDLTRQQLQEYNRRSAAGHLVLRVFAGEV